MLGTLHQPGGASRGGACCSHTLTMLPSWQPTCMPFLPCSTAQLTVVRRTGMHHTPAIVLPAQLHHGESPNPASALISAGTQAQSRAEVVQKDIDKNGLGEAICKRADDLPAAVVVMAASSRGKRIRFVLGPTTEYCVGRCAHPVLVYHCS